MSCPLNDIEKGAISRKLWQSLANIGSTATMDHELWQSLAISGKILQNLWQTLAISGRSQNNQKFEYKLSKNSLNPHKRVFENHRKNCLLSWKAESGLPEFALRIPVRGSEGPPYPARETWRGPTKQKRKTGAIGTGLIYLRD